MTKKKTFLESMSEEFEDAFDSILVTEETDSKVEVIPTSSLSLNISTGIGGIPKKKCTEIFGAESSGKTTLALDICKNALIEKAKVLYLDVEHSLDYDYSHKIIGDYDEADFVILQPETAEQCLQMAEHAIQSGECNLVVIDSVGALAPGKEKEDELTDFQVGLIPRLLSKFIRRNAHAIKINNVAIVFINQLRDKIGSYIKDVETPGGHALHHLCSLRIYLSGSEKIKTADKEIIGNEVNFFIKKNKLAMPFKTFHYPLMFGIGIDSVKDTITFASRLGVIKSSGPYYSFEDVQLGQGINNTAKTLSENLELLDKINKMCYNTLNINKEGEEKVNESV